MTGPAPDPMAPLWRMPFREGGRGGPDGIDCLGVALWILEHVLRFPPELRPDPWARIRELWAVNPEAIAADPLFPAGWRRAPLRASPPPDGAMALGARSGCTRGTGHVALVVGGTAWSAVVHAGVVALPWSRVMSSFTELWIPPTAP